MPVTTHLFSEDPWELEAGVLDELAATMAAKFGTVVENWPAVIRSVVHAVDPYISVAALDEAARIAAYLGHDSAADWLDDVVVRPDLVEATVHAQLVNHQRLLDLGPFVRRRTTVRDGVDVGPGPWHESSCRFVARAGTPSGWEGVQELPGEGRLCQECRAGQPPAAAQRPHAEQGPARDAVRDEIAKLGAFVRRRGEDDFPPGKWHASGCRTTRTAADARMWEGADQLPTGEDACKTCLPGHH